MAHDPTTHLVPDLHGLLDAVMERSTGQHSVLHGVDHWKRVAAAGLDVARDTPGADPLVVFLFALFHDSMRLSDGRDPQHGPRGAELAGELRGAAFELDDGRMGLLRYACDEHTNGGVSGDPTVGTCWDADRLNLWRVGIEPDPRWLSTEAGRVGRRIVWARGLQRARFGWEELWGRLRPGG